MFWSQGWGRGKITQGDLGDLLCQQLSAPPVRQQPQLSRPHSPSQGHTQGVPRWGHSSTRQSGWPSSLLCPESGLKLGQRGGYKRSLTQLISSQKKNCILFSYIFKALVAHPVWIKSSVNVWGKEREKKNPFGFELLFFKFFPSSFIKMYLDLKHFINLRWAAYWFELHTSWNRVHPSSPTQTK